MKRLSYIISFIGMLMVANTFLASLTAQSCRINICVRDLPDSEIIISHRFGNRFFVDDTVKLGSDGCGTLSNNTLLDEGMYQLVLPGKKYVDFFIGDKQQFSLSTWNNALIDSLKFENSAENNFFYHWQAAMRQGGQDAGYWKSALDNFGDHIMAVFIKGLLPVSLPEELAQESDDNDHQMARYAWYRKHFFDLIDLSDERLLRTPLIHTKLEQYFNQVAPPTPDSVIVDCDRLIGKTSGSEMAYQYMLQFLLNYFSEPKIMGMDAVYVHLAEQYYLSGKAPWISETNLATIEARVKELKPTLIGRQAPLIQGLKTPAGDPFELNHLNHEFLVLYFWEPDCGHCKESTPLLGSYYDQLRAIGAEVVAINTRTDTLSWNDFIKTHKLNWINLYCPEQIIAMLESYQAWSTPKVFILDKRRKIIAKDLTVEQVIPFLENHLKGN